VVAVGGRGISFVSSDEKQLLLMNLVSTDFFAALGVKPAAGRLFTPRDEASGGLLVVLGNHFWHRQFGGDHAIVGKQIRLQRAHEVLATVIGVLPASFRDTETGGGDRDVWFSLPAWRQLGDAGELENRKFRWFRVLARLAPRASVASANAQVQALGARMAADWPESNRGRRAGVISDLYFRVEQAGQKGTLAIRSRSEPQIKIRRPVGLWHHTKQAKPCNSKAWSGGPTPPNRVFSVSSSFRGALRQCQEPDIGAGKPQGLMVEALEFDFSDDQSRVQEASPREAPRGHSRGGLGREEEATGKRESRQSSREVQEGLTPGVINGT
jgi:hypothetical protein